MTRIFGLERFKVQRKALNSEKIREIK